MLMSGIVSGGQGRTGESLAERAYQAVREQLLTGQLRLGAPVSGRHLAEELGMSHLPVAQALAQLERDGYLESRPRAGTRVRVPTETDIRERYEVREALESQAARLFARRATAAEKRELRVIAEHLDARFNSMARHEGDERYFYSVHSFHFDLHMKIASWAECGALRGMIESNHILTFNWVYDVAANRRALPLDFHRKLAEALTSGDEATADMGMREHVRYGLEERIANLSTLAPSEWRRRKVRLVSSA